MTKDRNPAPFSLPRPTEPTLLPERSATATYRLRVELEDVEPPIWREVELPSDVAMDDLHDVLQIVMGWTNSHLHCFARRGTQLAHDEPALLNAFDVSEQEDGVFEGSVELSRMLGEVGDEVEYRYDYGDGWTHAITLLEVRDRSDDAPRALCLAGARNCPPEDCGGPWGYEKLVDLLAAHRDGRRVAPEDRYLLEAYPDHQPEEFSVEEVNGWLAKGRLPGTPDTDGLPEELARWIHRLSPHVASQALDLARQAFPHGALAPLPNPAETEELVHDFVWFLNHVGEDGITFTPAGWLPPKDVRATFQALAMEREWMGSGSREEHTLPVLRLRESMQSMGLLRKYRGKLLLTKLGARLRADPHELLMFLAGKFPTGTEDYERIVASFALLGVAAGRGTHDAEVRRITAAVLTDLGWRMPDGPIHETDVITAALPTTDVLARLGVPDAILRRAGDVHPRQVAFARMALRG